jgi:hypothetical protein
MSAAIASGVVGIGDYLIVDCANEGGVVLNAQADPPLIDRSWAGLQGSG